MLYTDTIFIMNQYNHNLAKRNKYVKSNICIKLSIITDKLGMPILYNLFSENRYDSNILFEQSQSDFFVQYPSDGCNFYC